MSPFLNILINFIRDLAFPGASCVSSFGIKRRMLNRRYKATLKWEQKRSLVAVCHKGQIAEFMERYRWFNVIFYN